MTTPDGSSLPPEVQVDTSQQDMRDMISQLLKKPYDFDPCTMKTAVVAGFNINLGLLDLQLSGDSSIISGVRYLDSYGPNVGDIVNLLKQGTDMVVLSKVSDGLEFLPVSFNSGWSGSVYYRLSSPQGSRKMEFTGRANRASGAGFTIGNLPVGFRPFSQKSVVVAREWTTGSTSVVLTFNTDGTINADGMANQYGTGAVSDHNHFHYHEHNYWNTGDAQWEQTWGGPSGGDGLGGAHNHNYGASNPPWISFDNVSFYL